ncbi:MAG: hypothetical protein RSB67_01830 [Clostridia bacterium]
MKIEKRLLSFSDMTRCGQIKKEVKKILIVYADEFNKTSNERYNYLERLKYQSDIYKSANYIIDKKAKIINIIPEEEIAYATEIFNIDNESIIVEVCSKKISKELEKKLVELLSLICIKNSLNPKKDILRLYDVINTRNFPLLIDNNMCFENIKNSTYNKICTMN